MVDINLLPKERRPKKPLIYNKKLLFIMICLILFLIYLLMLNKQVNNYLKIAEDLKVEINSYYLQIMDIEDRRAYGDLLEKQIQIYNELLEGNNSWGQKLEDLSKTVPENSFITAIYMEDNKFLIIKGYALTLGDIAEFIDYLNAEQYYTSVRLHNAIKEVKDDITLLKYEIVCGI